jgi:glycerol-1-phosphate dehydrogenase [NAD(P)+]
MKTQDPFISALMERGLALATDTRHLSIAPRARFEAGEVFARLFGQEAAVVVADLNTWEAAGRDVHDALKSAGQAVREPFVFEERKPAADWAHAVQLQSALEPLDAVALAVGSGTINDLTKLVSGRLQRPYLCVGTAASMDGYTSFGASITCEGHKVHLPCPAPRAVLADLEAAAAAPPAMGAAGYADLLAKFPAGACWMLAGAVGVEAIDPEAWSIVQDPLPRLLDNPAGIPASDPAALERLFFGLMAGGFGMQHTRSSRVAAGCEHQFSHLWDMQGHTFQGSAPSHGFKVGIGSLASTRFHEYLLAHGLEAAEPEVWPSPEEAAEAAAALFADRPPVARVAREEVLAKHPTAEQRRAETARLRAAWPALSARIRAFLPPAERLSEMLRTAGAPYFPEQIGISVARLRDAHLPAASIRRRYTVLDAALRAGCFHAALQELYPSG